MNCGLKEQCKAIMTSHQSNPVPSVSILLHIVIQQTDSTTYSSLGLNVKKQTFRNLEQNFSRTGSRPMAPEQ